MRRILFWGVIAIALSLALVWTISSLPEDSVPAVLIGAVVIVGYAGLAFLWTYLRRARKAAGALLLDCGPVSVPWSGKGRMIESLLAIGSIGLLGYVQFVLRANAGANPAMAGFLAALGPIYGLLIALWLWKVLVDRLLFTGHLKLREHGIWSYMQFTAWDKALYHHWENDKCIVTLSRREFFQSKVFLIVPREVKTAAQAIIAARCPTEKEYLLARADA